MRFSTFFNVACVATSAFALPQANKAGNELVQRDTLIGSLTTIVNSALTLVNDITSDLDKSIESGDLVSFVPELVTDLGKLNDTLEVVREEVTKIVNTPLIELLPNLGGTVVQLLAVLNRVGDLLVAVTTLVNKILSTPGLADLLKGVSAALSGVTVALTPLGKLVVAISQHLDIITTLLKQIHL